MIRIREITENEQNLFDDLQGLIGQLTERPASRERLAEMIADPHVILLVAEAEGRRIGILTLALYDTLTARRGWVEDVVVDAAFRGCGAGRALVEAAVRRSAELGIDTLSLTSAPPSNGRPDPLPQRGIPRSGDHPLPSVDRKFKR